MFTEENLENTEKHEKEESTLIPLPRGNTVNGIFSTHSSLIFVFHHTNPYFNFTEYMILTDYNWKMFKRAV